MTIRRFVQGLFVALAVLSGLALVVAGVADANHRALMESQRTRTESLRLAGELRQSSDNLTRFARTYVATGDARYEGYYRDILAIRNGEKPRPLHYDQLYWDFVADGRPPETEGRTVPLQQLMRESGFSPGELAKLGEAQALSDSLVRIEQHAMRAIRGEFADASGAFTRRARPDQALALRLLFGAAYHHEKARIMAGIDEFLTMVDTRTASELDLHTRRSARYWRLIEVLVALLVGLLAVSFSLGRRRVFEPVGALQRQTAIVATDLARLATVAKQNAEGQSQQRFATTATPLGSTARDEVGDLSRLHDAMIAQLQEAGASIATLTRDLRVAKDAAERASRAKSTFLATVSHEIRTPMNAIQGYGQLLRSSTGLTAEQRRKLDVIGASGEHLLRLINDILDMSRIEAERVSLSVEPFDLPALVREVGTIFEPQAAAHRLALDVHVDPGVPRGIEADPGKVHQVLSNLVGNAIKFTEAGGVRVRATAHPAGRDACTITIEVEDTGPGIQAEELESVFEAFVQTPVGARRGGTGLGLAISRNFARLMSGDVTVRSTPGRGSTFTFSFTATIVPDDLIQDRDGPAPALRLAAHETRRKALVVDDVATNRELLLDTLSRLGFFARAVTSGEDAIALHGEWSPDLIITDLHMPGIGGLEAIRVLRARQATTPVIVCTASTDAATGVAVIEAGAQRLLMKPCRERELRRTLTEVLGVEFVAVPPDWTPDGASAPPAAVPSDNLTGEIPAALADAVREAARQARANRLEELCAEVNEHSPRAAQLIRGYAENFQYAAILKALNGELPNDA